MSSTVIRMHAFKHTHIHELISSKQPYPHKLTMISIYIYIYIYISTMFIVWYNLGLKYSQIIQSSLSIFLVGRTSGFHSMTFVFWTIEHVMEPLCILIKYDQCFATKSLICDRNNLNNNLNIDLLRWKIFGALINPENNFVTSPLIC